MPNEEKPRVISTQDIRSIRNKVRTKGRKGLSEQERKLAVSLGVIREVRQ